MVDKYGLVDRLTGGTASACGTLSGTPAGVVADDGVTTYWHSEDAALPHWWKYDLGVGKAWRFGKLRLLGTIAGTSGLPYKDIIIQGSNDDSTFTNLSTIQCTNTNGWQEFTFSNLVAYRYLRLWITSTYRGDGAPQCPMLYEAEAFEILSPPTGFFIFLSEAWNRHKKLWTPKLLLPEDLGFSY